MAVELWCVAGRVRLKRCQICHTRMATKRCSSADIAKPRTRREMRAVGLLDLVEFSQKLRSGRFQILPWISDTRGNAFSVNSRGHIHHPENLGRVAVNWACLTERLRDVCCRFTCCSGAKSYSGNVPVCAAKIPAMRCRLVRPNELSDYHG